MDKTNCLCPECGGELEVMCVSKANDSPSGLLELFVTACNAIQTGKSTTIPTEPSITFSVTSGAKMLRL